ncbi:Xaa-Pro aminopeptidase [Paenibacillus endophyticus]|uniref:Xaa-Pro aminopeptidase n=1 Tax=Paenibacillus endophyticus TaxID=1294268 RepID=A0A7W5CCM4_9BACL|nr:Xaa-Pro peptidase family protein [Paenibacillus endophyticus]MBB3154679.1 Xaa-Pro aminopeptidase [Paenibacillus endophyticus]
MMNARLSRLRSVLKEKKLEAILISHGPNRRYISGFTGSSGYAVVTGEHALLLTDFRYLSQAKEQAATFDVERHGVQPLASIAEHIRKLGVRELAFEANRLTLAQAKMLLEQLSGIACLPTEEILEKLRNVKDEAEIASLREAARIADEAFFHILPLIRPGTTERRIAAELEYRIRLLGAECGWPGFIVASGYRSALPHGVASTKEIGNDEFVTLDFGAIVNGYMSDVTRTVFVGKPDGRQREIYATVLAANEKAIRGLRPGLDGKQGDALGRDVIAERGYGEYFGHGLGHGIGLEIHEQLRLSQLSDSILEPGNVLTVEPGIYIPNVEGVRIEDDVLIKPNGVDVLTSSPKALIAL